MNHVRVRKALCVGEKFYDNEMYLLEGRFMLTEQKVPYKLKFKTDHINKSMYP